MSALVNLIDVSPQLWMYLAIDMLIAIGLLVTLRLTSGRMAKVSSSDELCAQDNNAFGLSMAGRMLALCIVLSAAVESSAKNDFSASAVSMLLYGLVGILLIKIGRIAHDKIILNRLDKEDQIRKRNISLALVDASSSIATALIIRSVMLWVQGSDTNALVAIFSGFIITQAILLATTRIYERRFKENNQSGSLQRALSKGQLALAVQHSGHLLGTAIVVTGAGDLLNYNPVGYISNLTSWLFVGLALTVLLTILVSLAKRIILAGMDLINEVDLQHNVGIAGIELALSVGIASILVSLVA